MFYNYFPLFHNYFSHVSQVELKREGIEIEPFTRESVDFEMKAPTKIEKPEAPEEEFEITLSAKKPTKGISKDEVDATELISVPKTKVGEQFVLWNCVLLLMLWVLQHQRK